MLLIRVLFSKIQPLKALRWLGSVEIRVFSNSICALLALLPHTRVRFSEKADDKEGAEARRLERAVARLLTSSEHDESRNSRWEERRVRREGREVEEVRLRLKYDLAKNG